MPRRLLKCYGDSCVAENKKYPQDELYQYGGKNYCFKHYHQKLKDKQDRQRLYGLISKNFNIEYPTGLMLSQIKKFQDINHYTLEGIAEAVDYMSTQSWVNMDVKFGLGLVPHVYEDAKEEKIRKDMQASVIKNKQSITDTKEVTIKEKKFEEESKVIKSDKFDFTV